MIKRTLMARFHRTRGSQAFPKVQALLQNLSDAESMEMVQFLQNLDGDARSDGARDSSRSPWKHGW